MSLYVEVVQSLNSNPPLLILNHEEIYPILNISVKGVTNKNFTNYDESFILFEGSVEFTDIFEIDHYLVIHYSSDDNITETQEALWKKRVDSLSNFALSQNKDPEKDESKLIPPWIWNVVPEKDLPKWMKHEEN